jgi:hypothetical protein
VKKILTSVSCILVSATPALAHEIGMKHDHWEKAALGILIGACFGIVLLYAKRRKKSKAPKS